MTQREMRSGYVYAIADGDRVKIGWSRDPIERLKSLRPALAPELKLLGVIPGTQELERDLHESFAQWRIHGEWFRHIDAVADFTATLPQLAPQLAQGTPQTHYRRSTAQRFQQFQEQVRVLIRKIWPDDAVRNFAALCRISPRHAIHILNENHNFSAEVIWRLLNSVHGPAFYVFLLESLDTEWAREAIKIHKLLEAKKAVREAQERLQQLTESAS